MRAALGVLDVVFLVTAFGVRTLIQWRDSSDSGWRLGAPRSWGEAVARAGMFGSGLLIGVSLATSSRDPSLPALGVAICVAAIAGVFVAQLQMGASWRIGVDPDERTELVRHGMYRWVRNPIYLGMVMFVAGHATARPNVVGVVAFVVMLIGVEAQVRAVEEPYLRHVHGAAFTEWATTSGRFLPRRS